MQRNHMGGLPCRHVLQGKRIAYTAPQTKFKEQEKAV